MEYRIPRFKNKRIVDPHVVIIGAGASKAAVPIDKNGKEVPLLKEVCKVLGLVDELKGYGFNNEEIENFELLYSHICHNKKMAVLKRRLETAVREYFQKLEIPDEINLYDYLILSLTSKDAIISFNWDPFLIQSYLRNIDVQNLPEIIFPHGNVGVGLCYKCKNKGYFGYLCSGCLKPLVEMPLLFPIEDKDYDTEEIIRNEWTLAKKYLSRAAAITIFGYGAPETDKKAVDLIKSSFAKSNTTYIAPFTIINLLKEKEKQLEKWSGFFTDQRLWYCEHLEDSILWKLPRVTIEYFFDANLQQQPRRVTKTMEHFKTLEELQQFVQTIDEFDVRV